MSRPMINLKSEQEATLARPRYAYSRIARFFYWMMDVVAGKKMTLSKAKLIEILATMPYRAWEVRQYARMTSRYRNRDTVQHARSVTAWSREAQDNEYWHLIVINEKMKEDGEKEAWYLFPPVTFLFVGFYIVMTRLVARLNIRQAFHFNAEFEDHAEHVYAEFVQEHPEWDEQPIREALRTEYVDFKTWGDAFRRIGLDERDHMNTSFMFCGRPEHIVKYEGMPGHLVPDISRF